jgi:hypothetical protein
VRAAEQIQREVNKERDNGSIIFLPSAIVPESFYRPVLERVWLTDDDIYESQKKHRIRYEGLLKLANAAGIEWSPVDSGRTDNGSDKLYISFRAVGLIRKADGKLYPTAANYDLDLELVKEELEEQYRQKADRFKKTGQDRENYIEFGVKRDWIQKRKHKATLAESGAKARVIRSVLGLQSQYSNKQDITGHPFVIVRFVLDHQNPDIKQAMLSAARENMSAIYGGGSPPQALPTFESAEVIDVSHSPLPNPFEQSNSHASNDNSAPPDSRIVDFENSDVDTQVKTLEAMAAQKQYDLDGFLSRGKVESLSQVSEAKRIDFFNYLNSI